MQNLPEARRTREEKYAQLERPLDRIEAQIDNLLNGD
jgi:hypothetical protein